jgi:hypothetical protein
MLSSDSFPQGSSSKDAKHVVFMEMEFQRSDKAKLNIPSVRRKSSVNEMFNKVVASFSLSVLEPSLSSSVVQSKKSTPMLPNVDKKGYIYVYIYIYLYL